MIREAIIADLIKGKDTLDIGSIGQSGEYKLWDILKANAGKITGVDLPDAVINNKKIFNLSKNAVDHNADENIVLGNMETLDLGKQYDVVVAGDVIEHVYNPGLFLGNIHQHLKAGGLLIITTPNAKWPTVFCKPNPTHVLWHDMYTLDVLLNNHGFEKTFARFYYGNKKHYNFIKRLLTQRQSILYVAKKVEKPVS